MAMEWKKHRVLGSGSYGTVYLATPVNDYSFLSSSLAAVKSADVPHSSSLKKEAKFLSELRGNSNIIQCFGEDTSLEKHEHVYNLFLEYAAGGSLLDLIKNNKGTIPESHVACYAFMLLTGISAIHECDIVHCDLKPSNILVFPNRVGGNIINNQLKIADFGLARRLRETDEVADNGICRGTPIYASPESITCGMNDKATDIWSLGCTVLEMITGKPVWSCRDVQDLMHVAIFGNAKKKIPENLSQDGKDFLRRCLKRNPEARWTAKMLMDHPFITRNLLSHDQSQPQANPFGQWISATGLFANSSVDEASKCSSCSFYRLFPENKAQDSQHPLLCGFELFNLYEF